MVPQQPLKTLENLSDSDPSENRTVSYPLDFEHACLTILVRSRFRKVSTC